MSDELTVGKIAKLTGVSVRTLHHYDEIGLVKPAERSRGGYRVYSIPEIERLQEVLIFKELGLALSEIKRLVSDQGYTRLTALRRHRRVLENKVAHLSDVIAAVDTALAAERMGEKMSSEDLVGVFGGFDPNEFAAEAEERWGDTETFRESARRTSGYSVQDWEQIGRENADINDSLISLMNGGEPADGVDAMDLAERHRSHISKWFYECTPDIHVGLAQMYVTDERFSTNIDKAAPGLANYLSQAIRANNNR